MSCLRYRKIKNPIKPDRVGFYDKKYISIPDCRCSKCRKAKSNDWLVRSYFEYTSKSHTAFFVTLDFDDEHLPVYNGVPCFDSKLMSSFMETLRQSKLIPAFRFLYSSDYGGALERPHYHCIFLFDKDSISYDSFSMVLQFYWKYGKHENIQKVGTRYAGNPFKAFEYVCKYTTKELSYELRTREAQLPKRYRSLTSASLGYGAQCMDPNEIRTDRLLVAGVKFLDTPVITRDYILNNSVLYLNIKNNGELVPFSIPRYYELKLMYDTSHDIDGKVIQRKNAYGRDLQALRHNTHYVQVYNNILNSRHLNISEDPEVLYVFQKCFPDSPYIGMMWIDVLDDILIDKDWFWHCVELYDYLDFVRYDELGYISIPRVYEFNGSKFFNCCLGRYFLESRSLPYYKYDLAFQAIFMFTVYNQLRKSKEAHYDDWEMRENNKARLLYELQKNPRKRNYLKHKKFNFSKLNFNPYVPLDFPKAY